MSEFVDTHLLDLLYCMNALIHKDFLMMNLYREAVA